MNAEFKRTAHGIEITMCGTLTMDELREVRDIIYSPGVMNRQIHYLLLDFTGVTYFTLRERDIRRMAQKDNAMAHRRSGLWVVFLTGNGPLFTLCHQWKTLLSGSGLIPAIFGAP